MFVLPETFWKYDLSPNFLYLQKNLYSIPQTPLTTVMQINFEISLNQCYWCFLFLNFLAGK